MAYQANIPQASDKISKSQGDLLGNFQSIGSNLFTGANMGMPAITPPAALSGIVQMFAATSTLTLQPEFFIQRQSGSVSSVTTIEFTSTAIKTIVIGGITFLHGYSRLPSGILIKWGGGNVSGSGTLVFPTTDDLGNPMPAFSSIYNVQLTTYKATPGNLDANTFIQLSQFSTLSFFAFGATRTVASTPVSVNFEYLAIGI